MKYRAFHEILLQSFCKRLFIKQLKTKNHFITNYTIMKSHEINEIDKRKFGFLFTYS